MDIFPKAPQESLSPDSRAVYQPPQQSAYLTPQQAAYQAAQRDEEQPLWQDTQQDNYPPPRQDTQQDIYPHPQQYAHQAVQTPDAPYDDSVKKFRCPGCGSTDTVFNAEKGVFICEFCRKETVAVQDDSHQELLNTIGDIKQLDDFKVSAGMSDVVQSQDEVLSFKCPSCKAELSVAANTDIGSLRCHWCRHLISVADKITNGVRPDGLIPFIIPKEQAMASIGEYLNKRKFFAHPRFVKDFTIDLIRPVYLPYILTDIKADSSHSGEAAIRLRKYTVKSGKNRRTVYDYEVYKFSRTFNLYINDLMIEANRSYIQIPGRMPTNDSRNIINSIQPFDVQKVVDYNPMFLNGDYRAEFRNLNLNDVKQVIQARLDDISMEQAATATMSHYTHGMKFFMNNVRQQGGKFDYILAPVWLYSYLDHRNQLNYICVNGQTGETAASVPINKTKLFLVSAVIEIAAIILFILLLLA